MDDTILKYQRLFDLEDLSYQDYIVTFNYGSTGKLNKRVIIISACCMPHAHDIALLNMKNDELIAEIRKVK